MPAQGEGEVCLVHDENAQTRFTHKYAHTNHPAGCR